MVEVDTNVVVVDPAPAELCSSVAMPTLNEQAVRLKMRQVKTKTRNLAQFFNAYSLSSFRSMVLCSKWVSHHFSGTELTRFDLGRTLKNSRFGTALLWFQAKSSAGDSALPRFSLAKNPALQKSVLAQQT